MFAVGTAAATTVSEFDILDGNALLETISYGRHAGLRVVSSALPLRNTLNFHEQYVPMKLLYKEKFNPLVAFSHMHHSVSTPTSSTLHLDKVAGMKMKRSGESLDASSGHPMSPDAQSDGGRRPMSCGLGATGPETFSEPVLSVLCFALPSSSSELHVGTGEGLSLRIVVNNIKVKMVFGIYLCFSVLKKILYQNILFQRSFDFSTF